MLATAALEKNEDFFSAGDIPAAISAADRLETLKSATAQQTVSQDRQEIFALAAGSTDLMAARAAEFAALTEGKVHAVCVKAEESANFKIDNEYAGVSKFLCDPVRATVIIPASHVDVCRAALALHESTVAVKDLIASPSKTGLAILNAKVKLENGLVGEIQFVTPYMHQAMQSTHDSYKKIDSLTAAFAEVALPIEIGREIKKLKTDCMDYHATGSFLDKLDRYVDKKRAGAHSSPAFTN